VDEERITQREMYTGYHHQKRCPKTLRDGNIRWYKNSY